MSEVERQFEAELYRRMWSAIALEQHLLIDKWPQDSRSFKLRLGGPESRDQIFEGMSSIDPHFVRQKSTDLACIRKALARLEEEGAIERNKELIIAGYWRLTNEAWSDAINKGVPWPEYVKTRKKLNNELRIAPIEAIQIARKANVIAEDANRIASTASDKARKANRIAIISAVISVCSLILLGIQQFSSSENGTSVRTEDQTFPVPSYSTSTIEEENTENEMSSDSNSEASDTTILNP
jgi:hypothetical protein